MMTMSRMTTLRTMTRTARMTGKDDDDSKDNDSKDNNNSEEDSNVGKDDNNDGGNNDSGGGGGDGGDIGEQVGGVARSVAWLVAMFFTVGCLALTYRRNCRDTFGNKFILV
jgi:hypothetical protein